MFPDLVGPRPVEAAKAIDWSYVFDLSGSPMKQPAKRTDWRLPTSLIRLPTAITGDIEAQLHSLAGARRGAWPGGGAAGGGEAVAALRPAPAT